MTLLRCCVPLLLVLGGCATVRESPLSPNEPEVCATLQAPLPAPAAARQCAAALRSSYVALERGLLTDKHRGELVVLGSTIAGVAAAAYEAHVDAVKGFGLLGASAGAVGDYLAPSQRAAAARIGIDGMSCILDASSELNGAVAAYAAVQSAMQARVSAAAITDLALVAGVGRLDATASLASTGDAIREAIFRVYAKVIAAYRYGKVDAAALKAALQKAIETGKAAQQAEDAAAAMGDDVRILGTLAAEVARARLELATCGA